MTENVERRVYIIDNLNKEEITSTIEEDTYTLMKCEKSDMKKRY